jgi:hypothetical protein
MDKSEPADGNGLVQLGAAYMSYGQYDKALANIQKGFVTTHPVCLQLLWRMA